jgi:acid phosphatase family membrane protein YuiD
MDILKELLFNQVLWVPVFAWMAAQITKLIVNLLVERHFDISRIFGDGGMPSGHAATVTSLMIMVGWTMGLSSPVFALSAVFAIVVIRDAMGVRREAGKQAKTIKELAQVLNEMILEKDEQIRSERLKELVGHTPLQVFFGMLLGAAVAVSYCLIARVSYGVTVA